MDAKELFPGDVWKILGITNPKCLAEDFLKALPKERRRKMFALLERSAQYGLPTTRERFKSVEDGILEFKSHQDRILCFFERGHVIVLTHGFSKKSDDIQPSQIERAKRLRAEYRRGTG